MDYFRISSTQWFLHGLVCKCFSFIRKKINMQVFNLFSSKIYDAMTDEEYNRIFGSERSRGKLKCFTALCAGLRLRFYLIFFHNIDNFYNENIWNSSAASPRICKNTSIAHRPIQGNATCQNPTIIIYCFWPNIRFTVTSPGRRITWQKYSRLACPNKITQLFTNRVWIDTKCKDPYTRILSYAINYNFINN